MTICRLATKNVARAVKHLPTVHMRSLAWQVFLAELERNGQEKATK